MPLVIAWGAVVGIAGVGAGYSLHKIEDITELALIGGGVYIVAKAFKVI